MSLILSGVAKSFGRLKVLDGVSFAIDEGEVVGFVGPNGAGKSTTMKAMLGLVHADAGEISADGFNLRKHRAEFLRLVGGLVDGPGMYPILSASDHVRYVAEMRGLDPRATTKRVLESVGLSAVSRKPVSQFSMGMKQRLAIAIALVHSPRYLILDEPTNGLDPNSIAEFRSLVAQLRETGMGVLISSHVLAEIERLCDRVVFIRCGRIVRQIAAADQSDVVVLSVRTTNDVLASELLAYEVEIEDACLQRDCILVSIRKDRVPRIAECLVGNNVGLLELHAANAIEISYTEEFQKNSEPLA